MVNSPIVVEIRIHLHELKRSLQFEMGSRLFFESEPLIHRNEPTSDRFAKSYSDSTAVAIIVLRKLSPCATTFLRCANKHQKQKSDAPLLNECIANCEQ